MAVARASMVCITLPSVLITYQDGTQESCNILGAIHLGFNSSWYTGPNDHSAHGGTTVSARISS